MDYEMSENELDNVMGGLSSNKLAIEVEMKNIIEQMKNPNLTPREKFDLADRLTTCQEMLESMEYSNSAERHR